VDLIICDYNYALDPTVSLARHFADEPHDYAILVDESHNLVDRAREMFSADLMKAELVSLETMIPSELPACAKALKKIALHLSKMEKDPDWIVRGEALVRPTAPTKIQKLVKTFISEAERWLVQDKQSDFRQSLLEVYFRALKFNTVLDLFDRHYIAIYEATSEKLRLFCIDPSRLLSQALKRTGSSVFFSATLTPAEFFRESLGGDLADPFLRLASPFPRENLCILVHAGIPTRFRDRSKSYDSIAHAVEALVRCKTGNYIVYFPSYDYLNRVLETFRLLFPHYQTIVQNSGMTEGEREKFLSAFQTEPGETLVGFAVLGGIFGEGIDLTGERLIGVAVVGVGLPQISLDRDLIREFWQTAGQSGFDYAYTFPGMNRVLQAVGRLIRSDKDQGVVLLIDDRFGKHSYRTLFPSWWNSKKVTTPKDIECETDKFWAKGDSVSTAAQAIEVNLTL
jgi:DNA excision repair protein ERCC-2